jgi:ATP-dependent Clp protease ATP-binding subunit ClpA
LCRPCMSRGLPTLGVDVAYIGGLLSRPDLAYRRRLQEARIRIGCCRCKRLPLPRHSCAQGDLLLLEGEDAGRLTFRPADHTESVRRAQIMTAVRTAPRVPITRIERAKQTRTRTQTPNQTESLEPPVPQPAERAFEGIVGQDRLLEQLEACARGRRARGEAFPHTIFLGPPGTGKTTLSRGVAALVGSPLHETCGPS